MMIAWGWGKGKSVRLWPKGAKFQLCETNSPRDLLFSIVQIKLTYNKNEEREAFISSGYIYGIVYGSFIDIYLPLNSSRCIH